MLDSLVNLIQWLAGHLLSVIVPLGGILLVGNLILPQVARGCLSRLGGLLAVLVVLWLGLLFLGSQVQGCQGPRRSPVATAPAAPGGGGTEEAAPAPRPSQTDAPDPSRPPAQTTPETTATGKFRPPLDDMTVMADFGLGPGDYGPKNGKKWHAGVDLDAGVGTPVYPIAQGTVVCFTPSGWTAPYDSNGREPENRADWRNFGIVVQHESDTGPFLAVYGHLRRPSNPTDSTSYMTDDQIRNLRMRKYPDTLRSLNIDPDNLGVSPGHPLGQVGEFNTGNGEADHLHFGIYASTSPLPKGFGTADIPRPDAADRDGVNSYGDWLDPLQFLRVRRPR